MENSLNDETLQASDKMEDLERTCFVIMPFGEKEVAGTKVDFDAIFENLFSPAISKAETPEGQSLIAKRTDMDAFSGSINQDMFEYIMYSRVAFADISGFNPNVFYEIGARHSVQESGTVLFRQTGHAIPFDIATIKVFEYDHKPDVKAKASRNFITDVLSESLKRNRLDSPVRLALRAQWCGSSSARPSPSSSDPQATPPESDSIATVSPGPPENWNKQVCERFMRDAEEALRLGDLEMTKTNYWAALKFDPMNVIARMRLGLTLKSLGKNYEALGEFDTVTKFAADYAEAWKEKGVVEGLIARMIPADKRKNSGWLPDGFDSLKRSTLLNPGDFDAWASLGGVLKNVRNDYVASAEMYARASEISDGHPYPLLNALKMEALATGKLDLEPLTEQLENAKELRTAQIEETPPIDVPWSYFDLAEIYLFQGEKDQFLDYVKQGIKSCNAAWQPKTFRDSLKNTLVASKIKLAGLSDGIKLLSDAIKKFK